MLRRRAQHEQKIYFASLSCRTIVYKGMLTTDQLEAFYPELHDPDLASALALVHSRFSTNTFPSWPLAHPYRLIAHNGEINTVKGNRNWMRAREALLASDLIPGDLERLFPICTPGASDSASFDEVLELLHLGGRSLPHAVLMMIPEAYQQNPVRWTGPPGVLRVPLLADGALGRSRRGDVHRRHHDRRGARPQRPASRPLLGDDRRPGDLRLRGGRARHPQDQVQRKGRLRPGCIFLVDLEQHRVVDDEEVKAELAAALPYAEWVRGASTSPTLPDRQHIVHSHSSVTRRQQIFGYTHEELRLIVAPMANAGAEPIGSMGSDTPLAVLSENPRTLFDYFSQLFAQVTNPPLDAIREELVTSLASSIGPEQNLLAPGPDSCRRIVIDFPILESDELAKLVRINRSGETPGYAAHTVHGTYELDKGAQGLADRLEELCAEVDAAIAGVRRSSCSATATRPPSWRRSRRCCSPLPSTITWCGVRAATTGRPRRRSRRRARSAPRRAAHRLRRIAAPSTVPGVRVRRGPRQAAEAVHDRRPRKGRLQHHQVAGQVGVLSG